MFVHGQTLPSRERPTVTVGPNMQTECTAFQKTDPTGIHAVPCNWSSTMLRNYKPHNEPSEHSASQH